MKKRILIGVLVVITVAVALLWAADGGDDAADRDTVEDQLRDEGAMRDDGTIAVDGEFDEELNSLVRELNTAEEDGTMGIDALDTVE